MNKIFLLKILVSFITFLIFLTLIGIVYGIVNYKTTPKLFSGKKKKIQKTVKNPVPSAQIDTIYLNRADKNISTAFSCGEFVCLLLTDKNGNAKETVLIRPDDTTQPPVFVSVNAAP